MRSPAILSRVRVSGRNDDFIDVRIDHLARVPDICALADENAIEKNVSFSLLSATCESEAKRTDSRNHRDRLATGRNVLRSSFVQLSQSHNAIADLQGLIRSSVHLIETSQQLIVESDGVIARAQSGVIDSMPAHIP